MAIKLGGTTIAKISLGSVAIAKAYVGSAVFFSATVANLSVAVAFTGGAEAFAATVSTAGQPNLSAAAAFGGGTEAITTTLSTSIVPATAAVAFGGGAEALTAPLSTTVVPLSGAAAFGGGTEVLSATVQAVQLATTRYLALDTDQDWTAAEAKAGATSETDIIVVPSFDSDADGNHYWAFFRPAHLGTITALYLYTTGQTKVNQIGIVTLSTISIDGQSYNVAESKGAYADNLVGFNVEVS